MSRYAGTLRKAREPTGVEEAVQPYEKALDKYWLCTSLKSKIEPALKKAGLGTRNETLIEKKNITTDRSFLP